MTVTDVTTVTTVTFETVTTGVTGVYETVTLVVTACDYDGFRSRDRAQTTRRRRRYKNAQWSIGRVANPRTFSFPLDLLTLWKAQPCRCELLTWLPRE